MTNIKLTNDRDFTLDILEFNLYQIKNNLINGPIPTKSIEYDKLTRVQHLFNNVDLNLDLSFDHGELRELARCCFNFGDHFSHSSSSKIGISELSIKVLELFIKTCSKDAMKKIIKIIFHHEPNQADIETILAL